MKYTRIYFGFDRHSLELTLLRGRLCKEFQRLNSIDMLVEYILGREPKNVEH